MKTSALSALGRRTGPPPISWLMQTALSRPGLISLAAGFTDNATLPVELSRKLLNRVLRSPKSGQPALQYGITAGETNLRRLTARHVQKLDLGGTPCRRPKSQGQRHAVPPEIHSWEHVLITGGSQQLLYMTLEALCDEGDIVLVEDPTYFVFLSILQSRGIRARGVQLERDGIDLAHLETVLQRLKKSGELRRVKALYLVSYFQNPTGATTSFAKKARHFEAAEKIRARRRSSDLSARRRRVSRIAIRADADIQSALMVPGAADRVIYTGTYSKPYAPGARVGFGILPEPLFTSRPAHQGQPRFRHGESVATAPCRRAGKPAFTTGTSRKFEKRYAHKARVMKQALAEHFPPNVEIWESGGGLYFWARLPKSISTGVKSKVFQTALKNDVLYVPGELCYADDPSRAKPDHEMRISFGSASEENIREGIQRLGKVLKKILGTKSVG